MAKKSNSPRKTEEKSAVQKKYRLQGTAKNKPVELIHRFELHFGHTA